MIKTHVVQVIDGKLDTATKKVNKFLEENGISTSNVIGIAWNTFESTVFYADNKIESFTVLEIETDVKQVTVKFIGDDSIDRQSILCIDNYGKYYAYVNKITIDKDGVVYVTATIGCNWRIDLRKSKVTELKGFIGKKVDVIVDKKEIEQIQSIL